MNPIAYGMIGTFQDRWCSLIIIKLQFVYQKYRLTGAMQDQYTDWAAEMPPSISKCSKNNSISLSKPSAKQSCSCSNIKVNFPQNSFLISDIWTVFFVKLKKWKKFLFRFQLLDAILSTLFLHVLWFLNVACLLR